jgi:hypothetical protein
MLKVQNAPGRSSSYRRLEHLLAVVTLLLGLLHTWTGRYAMNPDGMSYLDVGSSFFRHDWANAINAWWSPLYAWTIGTVLGIFKPSPAWEFPLVHAVNFGVYAIALATFRFLLHGLIALRATIANSIESIPDWPLVLLAYPLFWWVALQVDPIYEITPDLAVVACLLAIAGKLVRLQRVRSLGRINSLGNFALLGLILGIGYWTKAVLFPLGFVALALAYFWNRSDANWRTGVVVAALVFLGVSSPLIFLLSKQKGRFTFGDSGRVNFAWYVCPTPRPPHRNWQGSPYTGTPAHTTRQLLDHPPVFEFDGPVSGTYPPWTDPSYWNEGIQGHFRVKPELDVLRITIPGEFRLLTRDQPALVVGVLVFALIGGLAWWANVARLWPVLALAFTGMAIYLPLVDNDRFFGGFVLVIFLSLFWAGQFLAEQKRTVVCLSLAVFVTMSLNTIDYTLRVLTHHYAIPGVAPNSTWEDVIAAQQLQRLGLRPGDKVAVIGDGTGAYWARLAKLKVVAEIMAMNHGSEEFWNSPPEIKENAYKAFASAHATKVIAACPGNPPAIPDSWQGIPGTAYCIRSVP